MNRRDFIAATAVTGFAAAVTPISAASLVTTPSDGLDAAWTNISVDGFSLPVYVAKPAGKSNLPIILVTSEIFGVHEHIADVARRFAKQGYLALAPELFIRQGDVKTISDIPTLMSTVITKVPDNQVMRDLDVCVEWAQANGGDSNRLAITGFCWGGRITWLYSAHNPKVKAGVAWYGKLVGQISELNPKQPVDIAAQLTVPVLGLYGGKDTGIPLDTVEQMQGLLKEGKSGSEFVIYPDAGHAFHADYRPSYLESAAKDGWTRCLAWLKAHGAA
ncbi:dienelactone hydrolase family protein [Leeia sp. TBRC 13508]|uniref:Dienelactone hydrolase family protein n=1 Tax=Leeia speluncae TaxID=2884804 RepID=A0ABS8D200_9NEIS|nr:dienelactone hydrolase family protein [Leeia speluncae]MCB6182212.1 dienelactone hydrolase family protein [Leeia speluncae]